MSQMIMIRDLVESVRDEVIEWRRYFHKYPELSFQEEKTAQFVYETLQTFGELEISRPTKTSVMARLIGQLPGKVIALRADMDALPIEEENDFDFVSQNLGVMHACGHDGHTAMLLGAAKLLTQLKEHIKGEIRFLFQHAEELFPGGAQEMVKAGVMDGVDQVIGIHLCSPIEVGKFGVCHGPATSGSDTFDIKIQGKGGHSSEPHATVDPIAVGSQVISNLQHIVSRNRDPLEKLVVSVTKFYSGTAYNVIPDTATLSGSIRSLNPELRKQLPSTMKRIVKGVTEAHDASFELDYHFGYSSVVNDDRVREVIEKTIMDVWGEDSLLNLPALMSGEDFSAFSDEVPGCFIFVGAGNQNKGIIYPHHHPRFSIDEDALEIGVELFVQSSFRLLEEPGNKNAE
ncbi:M20 family metallopeptidase [Bacillus pseudomycoides]|uniref:M20 family metallopeptidase n=1 Tax=Bacillus bingmayongensis TaxID=1150157 RepID=A0ABU5JT62_9BACI|nr:M20 family metallopeptidase [Bacillus pseudomycoides]